ncbi:MAG: hypothetical protein ACRECA_11765 [Pseudolabrys sp.]
MPSSLHVLECIAAAITYWGVVGFALSRLLAPPVLALPIAPVLGWAVHSALALPLYRIVGFTPGIVDFCSLAAFAAAGLSLLIRTQAKDDAPALRIPPLSYVCAAVLAIIVASAVYPKIFGDAVTLSAPIFDHSKVAMIDEMVRLGLPPGNPFFGEAGHEGHLVYYYLWHFSAAELALLLGVSGWEADIALTAVTAFSSLALMIGFAVWLGGRRAAAYFVVLLAFAASLHPALEFAVPPETLYSYILPPTGFAGWLFQTSWATQHVASAGCVVLSMYLLMRLAQQPSALSLVVLAAVTAAGYESSTWAGGAVFGAAALPAAVILLIASAPRDRPRFALSCAIAGLLTIALAFPFLKDQLAAATTRGGGRPIAIHAMEIFDDGVPDAWRRILDVPGYWLILLMIEFPAIYLPGLASLAACLRATSTLPDKRDATRVFGALTLVSLIVAGWFTITFAENNDLGWRAVLPAVLIMTIFAAIGFSRWLTIPMSWAAAGATALLVLSLPRSFQIAAANIEGSPSASDRRFAETPPMWDAVRKVAGPSDRVANNPLFLAAMTPWPINISWALLSDRRSCYAGSDFAIPFTSLPRSEVTAIDDQFRRVFDGKATAADVRDLADRYHCRVVVITPGDAAWRHDPFADSGVYTLVDDKPNRWKIYRATGAR